jgi:hypothetical protein
LRLYPSFVHAADEPAERGSYSQAALAVEHIRRESLPTAYLAAAQRLTGKAIRLVSRRVRHGGKQVRASRSLLLSAAIHAPGPIQTIVKRTRLPLPHPA